MAFYAYGPFKAEAMRQLAAQDGIDLSGSYAYSDSYTDAPMLEAVGHPVAVNPDRVLLKLAKERGWEVRNFAHPVPLRRERRVPTPPPGPTAAVGAAVAVAGVTWALVWWRARLRRPPEPPPRRISRPAVFVRRRLQGLSGWRARGASSWPAR